jgi:hypothetical protein
LKPGIRRFYLHGETTIFKFASKLKAMKIHLDLDKDTSIISLTIIIALMLMFSIFLTQAQGQSCRKTEITEKIQSSYNQYSLLFKEKYGITPLDSIKKVAEVKPKGSMKKIKKAVTSMLISQNRFETKNNMVDEFCYVPGSNFSNYQRYEKNK